MKRTDNGHITACKISDANPNEMIASWSGDHVYSFDLVRSPDAGERGAKNVSSSIRGLGKGKVRESVELKRKRNKTNSSTSLEGGRTKPNPRRTQIDEDDDLALRVRYENGQSEDIAMADATLSLPRSIVEEARDSILNESQRRSLRIAKTVVNIRKLIFSLMASSRDSSDFTSSESPHQTSSFTAALGLAATCLPEMDDISRSWKYPVNPFEEDIVLQQTLRGNRDSSRRFVQAAGTLARMLGGNTQTDGRTASPALDLFREINARPNEQLDGGFREIFSYDFLKAIILWLEGGPAALLQGFKRPPEQPKHSPRFPIPEGAQLSGIDDFLIPYLLGLARENAIRNIDASRFERDDTRSIFDTETAAIIAFANAVKIPFEDLSRAVMRAPGSSDSGSRPLIQDKKTALEYWGFRVGRSLLMIAGERVNYQFVDTAFGGLGTSQVQEGWVQEDINPDDDEEVVETVSLIRRSGDGTGEGIADNSSPSPTLQTSGSDVDIEDAGSDAEVILMDDLHDEIAEHMADEDITEDEDEDGNGDGDGDSDADEEGDDDNGDITAEERQFMFQSASDRGKLRERVEKGVPCYSHTRQYQGHCNVKTVKDANFFGIQDEYVVSGSDGGHLFIWDKKTSELLNILDGDHEVVNVVQGKFSSSLFQPSTSIPNRNQPQAIPTNHSLLFLVSTTPSRFFLPTIAPKKKQRKESTSAL